MADRDGIWSRGGVHVEDLPDPFAPIVVPPGPETVEAKPKPKRSRRRIILYSIAAALLVTLLWLIVTAPLSRALEPQSARADGRAGRAVCQAMLERRPD